MPVYVIGLGSNLGDRGATLVEAAVRLADASLGARVTALSHVYETDPVGPPQPRYLNAAVRLATPEAPAALLARCLDVERALGRDRTREVRWGPRTLDLDLLWWDGPDVHTPGLTIPHPHLFERAFALAPLAEVIPVQVRGITDAVARLGAPGPSVPVAGPKNIVVFPSER